MNDEAMLSVGHDDPAVTEGAIVEKKVEPEPGTRRAGVSTVRDGAIAYVVGFALLWISFKFADNARTILGAGPLIGGGMMGYGGVETVVGDRLKPLKWIVGVMAGLVGIGATLLILELTLGVTFA